MQPCYLRNQPAFIVNLSTFHFSCFFFFQKSLYMHGFLLSLSQNILSLTNLLYLRRPFQVLLIVLKVCHCLEEYSPTRDSTMLVFINSAKTPWDSTITYPGVTCSTWQLLMSANSLLRHWGFMFYIVLTTNIIKPCVS